MEENIFENKYIKDLNNGPLNNEAIQVTDNLISAFQMVGTV